MYRRDNHKQAVELDACLICVFSCLTEQDDWMCANSVSSGVDAILARALFRSVGDIGKFSYEDGLPVSSSNEDLAISE